MDMATNREKSKKSASGNVDKNELQAILKSASQKWEAVRFDFAPGEKYFIISEENGEMLLEEMKHLAVLVNPNEVVSKSGWTLSETIELAQKIGAQLKDLQDTYIGLLLTLASNMDCHEAYIGSHSERISILATSVAEELGCPLEEMENIRMAALLHDIGEAYIPPYILQKSSRLTDEEWMIIKEHPRIGAEFVTHIKKLEKVAEIIHSHHEKYDGSGYPDKIKGEDIPLGSRILSVVDAYDAMTNLRIHRQASSHQEAIDELKRCCGTFFDEKVVEAFIKLF
jgi:putative nucleotidyltransferase with HDIG domain